MPPDDALVDASAFFKISEPLENVATVHTRISDAADLFQLLQSPPFHEVKWAFRGQGDTDQLLAASIERVAIKPGVAEGYVEREFRRRAHHYLTEVPGELDDLEWLALMQHHGAPTRLLDWTKSPHVAAFFAAQSANPKQPFVIWAIDEESVNAEAVAMLGLAGDKNLSSRENFRKIYRDSQPENFFLVAPVQPYRMNERLTVQQGLFICANDPLAGFRRCLAALLRYATKRQKPSKEWLHKLEVAPETRLDVLRTLNRMNINEATLFPGLDGFSRSLRVNTEILEHEDWPGVPISEDMERWVRGA